MGFSFCQSKGGKRRAARKSAKSFNNGKRKGKKRRRVWGDPAGDFIL